MALNDNLFRASPNALNREPDSCGNEHFWAKGLHVLNLQQFAHFPDKFLYLLNFCQIHDPTKYCLVVLTLLLADIVMQTYVVMPCLAELIYLKSFSTNILWDITIFSHFLITYSKKIIFHLEKISSKQMLSIFFYFLFFIWTLPYVVFCNLDLYLTYLFSSYWSRAHVH